MLTFGIMRQARAIPTGTPFMLLTILVCDKMVHMFIEVD
jgi:hypothetical protein